MSSQVTVVFECRTCGARSTAVTGEPGDELGTRAVAAANAIEHQPVSHPLDVRFDHYEFPVYEAPSGGLFQPPG